MFKVRGPPLPHPWSWYPTHSGCGLGWVAGGFVCSVFMASPVPLWCSGGKARELHLLYGGYTIADASK